MTPDIKPDLKTELNTWQEIGAYLGVSVRTAQNWEKQVGLPVRRITEGPRGRVVALPAELDVWKAQRLNRGSPVVEQTNQTQTSSSSWWHPAFVAALVALALAGLFFALRPSPPEPRLLHGTKLTNSLQAKLSPLLSDGVRIYFEEVENGAYRIAQVLLAGGETTAVPTSVPNPEICDLSPDGKSMLLRSLKHSRDEDAPVFIQSLASGKVQRLGQIVAFDAAFHPDGRHIVYTADSGTFYWTELAGGLGRKMFSIPGNAHWIRWSPDAERVRFTVIDPKTEATSIWEAAADGRNPHRLFLDFQNSVQPCCGSWTPDGKAFVFQVRTGSTFQIWTHNERTRFLSNTTNAATPLTSGPINYRGPLLSKDGKRLFVRTEVLKGEMVRFDRKSHSYIPLLPGVSARTGAFSKDGNWIAYGSLTDNNLWRSRADGTERLQLTRELQQVAMPRWSPDGHQITFMGRRYGGTWGIFLVAASGGFTDQLSSSPQGDADPDWSPDGDELVFGNILNPSIHLDIRILHLKSRKVSILPGSAGYVSPRWSPDGRLIIAIRLEDKHLVVFDPAFQRWRDLTDIPAGYPNFSRSGTHVHFLSTNAGRRVVYRVDVKTRKLERVASLESVEQGSFFLGSWVGIAPDDSFIAVRNLTTEDLYSWNVEQAR